MRYGYPIVVDAALIAALCIGARRSLGGLLIKSGIVEHAEVLMVTKRLEVLVDIGRLSQIEFGSNVAVAEFDTAFVILDAKHLDMDSGFTALLLFSLLLLLTIISCLSSSNGKSGLKLQSQVVS